MVIASMASTLSSVVEARWPLPPLITAASILAILVTAHTLAGTPEIAATIAVPFTVSTSYAIIYNRGLRRARPIRSHHSDSVNNTRVNPITRITSPIT